MVWDPARITPRPWGGIVELYRHIEERNDDFRPMRVLAEHIASGPCAAAVFGATSGTALLVVSRAQGDFAREGLRIDVDLDGLIRFVEPASAPAKPHVTRFEPQRLVGAFDGALRRQARGW